MSCAITLSILQVLIIFFVVFTAIYYIDKKVDTFIAKIIKVHDMEIDNLTR